MQNRTVTIIADKPYTNLGQLMLVVVRALEAQANCCLWEVITKECLPLEELKAFEKANLLSDEPDVEKLLSEAVFHKLKWIFLINPHVSYLLGELSEVHASLNLYKMDRHMAAIGSIARACRETWVELNGEWSEYGELSLAETKLPLAVSMLVSYISGAVNSLVSTMVHSEISKRIITHNARVHELTHNMHPLLVRLNGKTHENKRKLVFVIPMRGNNGRYVVHAEDVYYANGRITKEIEHALFNEPNATGVSREEALAIANKIAYG